MNICWKHLGGIGVEFKYFGKRRQECEELFRKMKKVQQRQVSSYLNLKCLGNLFSELLERPKCQPVYFSPVQAIVERQPWRHFQIKYCILRALSRSSVLNMLICF